MPIFLNSAIKLPYRTIKGAISMKIDKLFMLSIVISGLFAFSLNTVVAIDENEIITDPPNDVYLYDLEGIDLGEIEELKYITEHPDIEVKNIDIREVRYNRQDTSVTLRIRVEGEIENRGNLLNFEDPGADFFNINSVEYSVTLITTHGISTNEYSILYSNKTCQIIYPDFRTENLTDNDYYVENKNTLVITFDLDFENETYEYLEGKTTFMKWNFSIDQDYEDFDEFIVLLQDIAPNPPVEAIAFVTNLGVVGKTIDFNGSAWFGQPPFTYHWDFGDGSTSTQKNPTHIYKKSGEYEYNLTVTDNSGDSASYSDIIEITGNGGDEDSTPIIIFVGVIVIIAIIGIIAIVYIIRR